ncbi:uncharacterized protein B0P05DRAFT_129509 [Gilbertella persicaria]|uniref:uncharacterized protein n=1 Tax=Gilbertella persicaria TaxID=101096 RepID=UPI00221F8AB4|nr:uncharacterized protein B0P05DRAFT_129509 [Gilbertella persicaria]KAI8077373.1 hypothetical protein B0P05DRAFT_129509 [Gilbertella persicaria]
MEQDILKLSLSRIIDLVDEDIAEYFKQHIPVHHFGMWSNLKTDNELTEEEQAKLKKIAQDFVQRVQSNLKAARKYILLKRVDYEEEQECSLEAKAYEIIDNINTLMKDNNNNHVQEADHVAFVKQLFRIVFRDANLKIAIGETVAAVTKPFITYNESSFSNSKDSIFISKSTSFRLAHTSSSRKKSYTGRKIDLKIIGDDDQELSFWEFKTRNANQKSLQHQESKTLRLTQCLQKSLKSAFDLKKDIMSITWSGWSGTVCQLYEKEDFYVAKKVATLAIPYDQRLIQTKLESFLLFIFEIKASLRSLNNAIFLESSTKTTKRKTYDDMPHIMLSPKRV